MRPIDADALVQIPGMHAPVKRIWFGSRSAGKTLLTVAQAFQNLIDAAPTIDAVPVVRCNMCKYYEADVGFCNYHDHGMHWDDFCSRGAKMDLEG